MSTEKSNNPLDIVTPCNNTSVMRTRRKASRVVRLDEAQYRALKRSAKRNRRAVAAELTVIVEAALAAAHGAAATETVEAAI